MSRVQRKTLTMWMNNKRGEWDSWQDGESWKNWETEERKNLVKTHETTEGQYRLETSKAYERRNRRKYLLNLLNTQILWNSTGDLLQSLCFHTRKKHFLGEKHASLEVCSKKSIHSANSNMNCTLEILKCFSAQPRVYK